MPPSIATKHTNKGTGTSAVTASIASTAGDVYVMVFGTNSAVPGSLAISGLGITWTLRVQNTTFGTSHTSIWTGTAVGNTGTITVSWTGSVNWAYEVVAVSGFTTPTFSYATSQAAAAHGSPGVWSWQAVGPLAGYAAILGYAIKTTVVPTWIPDATGPWTSGTTQTQGQFTQTIQWATSGSDPTPQSSYSFASGTGDSIGTALYIVESPLLTQAPTTLVSVLREEYTLGIGGFSPARLLHTDAGYDQLLSTAPASAGAGRDDTRGSPDTPSLQIRGHNIIGPFYWPARAGARTITAKVYYTPDDGASARPQMIIAAQSMLGIQSDQISTAPEGADQWQDFPTLTFTLPVAGVLKIYFKNPNLRYDGGGEVGSGSPPVFTNVDHIAVT